MLKIKTYHSFQSLSVSLMSRFVIAVSSERAESTCIRLAANNFSCLERNRAVLGPAGSQIKDRIAINDVSEPSAKLEEEEYGFTNDKKVLPTAEVSAKVKDTICDRAREGSGNCVHSVKQTDSNRKVVSCVEGTQVEACGGVEPGFEETD